jgi:hypothetical protein
MRICLAIPTSLIGSLLFTALLMADPPPREAHEAWAAVRTELDEPATWRESESDLPRFTLRWPVMNAASEPRSLADIDPALFRANSTARLILTQQSMGSLFVDRDDDLPGDDDGPDITKPGPDMGDYPNSAYTLRQGRIQLEMAPASFRNQNANNSSAYGTPFLFRYGVTNDVEFRVLGTGLTSLISPNQITGFGVITLDTKIHLWNDRMEYFIPAVSFEATLQTQWGSPAFQAGIEPGVNINMDFPFTDRTNLEMTIGYTGNQTDLNFVTRTTTGSAIDGNGPPTIQVNENIYVASLQWALEQEVTDKFEVFIHGYFAQPVGLLNDFSAVAGAGFFYQLSKQTMIFGSANAGLTNVPSPFLGQLGIAYIF